MGAQSLGGNQWLFYTYNRACIETARWKPRPQQREWQLPRFLQVLAKWHNHPVPAILPAPVFAGPGVFSPPTPQRWPISSSHKDSPGTSWTRCCLAFELDCFSQKKCRTILWSFYANGVIWMLIEVDENCTWQTRFYNWTFLFRWYQRSGSFILLQCTILVSELLKFMSIDHW